VFHLPDIKGMYRVREEFSDVVSDILLKGKFVAYEKALIFSDKRLHNFALSFDSLQKHIRGSLEKVIFHVGDDVWVELRAGDSSSFPLNSIGEPVIFLNFGTEFYTPNVQRLLALIGEDKVEVVHQPLTDFDDSLAYQNS
jgi:hypothetical protein